MLRHLGRTALAVTLFVLVGFGVATPAAFAGAGTSTLRAGETLAPGQRLISTTGVTLVMGTDGNLVESAPNGQRVWWLTSNRPGSVLTMQADGNLVLTAPGNLVLWRTNTGGNPGATFELGPDGNAAVYTTARVVKWSNNVRLTIAPPPSADPAGEVASLTNAERTKAGCAPLTVDTRLTSAAQGHATDMAVNNYFSHTSLDGRTFDVRIRNAGYPSPGGENIAKGQTSPSAVVTAWMNSTGHRANILNCSFKTIGVGFDARGNYWVQNFGY
jgi:hypothetical protein